MSPYENADYGETPVINDGGSSAASPVYATYVPLSTQTLTLNTYTKIIIRPTSFNTNGEGGIISVDETTGDITVTEAGTYLIHGNFMVYQNGTGDLTYVILTMWFGDVFKLRLNTQKGVFDTTTLTGHALIDLPANQVINFRIYASVSGGTAKVAQHNTSQGIYITKIQ